MPSIPGGRFLSRSVSDGGSWRRSNESLAPVRPAIFPASGGRQECRRCRDIYCISPALRRRSPRSEPGGVSFAALAQPFEAEDARPEREDTAMSAAPPRTRSSRCSAAARRPRWRSAGRSTPGWRSGWCATRIRPTLTSADAGRAVRPQRRRYRRDDRALSGTCSHRGSRRHDRGRPGRAQRGAAGPGRTPLLNHDQASTDADRRPEGQMVFRLACGDVMPAAPPASRGVTPTP
jgi:hypothetical protein